MRDQKRKTTPKFRFAEKHDFLSFILIHVIIVTYIITMRIYHTRLNTVREMGKKLKVLLSWNHAQMCVWASEVVDNKNFQFFIARNLYRVIDFTVLSSVR